MTREEHALILADILNNVGDPATISQKLTALSEDYTIALAQKQAADIEIVRLKDDNAKLVKVNGELFMKVGAVPPDEKPDENQEQPLTYDALFDENGKLK